MILLSMYLLNIFAFINVPRINRYSTSSGFSYSLLCLNGKFHISWTLLWAFHIVYKNKDFVEMVQTGCRQTFKMVYLFPSYGHLKSMVTYQHKLMTTHPKTCWCICFGFRFSDLIYNSSLWVTPLIGDLYNR